MADIEQPPPPPMLDDQVEEAPAPKNKRYTGNHATAAFFHVFFKAAAVLIYTFGGNSHKLEVSVCTVLFLAADFWTVKNVTGRLLVGLRWWNEIGENGESEWRFESGSKKINDCDKKLFWLSMIGNCLIWVLLSINDVLSVLSGGVKWLPLAVLALALNFGNMYGYYQCARKQPELKAQFTEAVSNAAVKGVQYSIQQGHAETVVNMSTKAMAASAASAGQK